MSFNKWYHRFRIHSLKTIILSSFSFGWICKQANMSYLSLRKFEITILKTSPTIAMDARVRFFG